MGRRGEVADREGRGNGHNGEKRGEMLEQKLSWTVKKSVTETHYLTGEKTVS